MLTYVSTEVWCYSFISLVFGGKYELFSFLDIFYLIIITVFYNPPVRKIQRKANFIYLLINITCFVYFSLVIAEKCELFSFLVISRMNFHVSTSQMNWEMLHKEKLNCMILHMNVIRFKYYLSTIRRKCDLFTRLMISKLKFSVRFS